MSVQSDLMVAINQIAAERNINPDEVVEAIKFAIKTSFREEYPEEEEALLEVEIKPEEIQPIRVFVNKKVVETVETPATQISVQNAQRVEKKLKEGDHLLVDITPSGDFGRVAAQVAKQVILQKIRESEKEAVMKEFVNRMGELEFGIVQRLDGDDVVWEIRRAMATMPLSERIPGEYYRSGARMKVLLKEIKVTPRGKQLIVSRADSQFLTGLFMLEVPEIASDTVLIKSIAREAGSRSKVAVHSKQEGIDPIGACVGQKGVRIGAVLNDLKFGNFEEKIDIILWHEDISQFIASALSPASVTEVFIVSEADHKAVAFVPDDQLSLAIGKEGQNVRLAAKLTGWNIDIMGELQKAEFMKTISPKTKTSGKIAEKKTKRAKEAEAAEAAKVEAEAEVEVAAPEVEVEVVAEKVEKKKTAVKKTVEKKAVAKKAPEKKEAVKKVVKKAAAVKKVAAKKKK